MLEFNLKGFLEIIGVCLGEHIKCVFNDVVSSDLHVEVRECESVESLNPFEEVVRSYAFFHLVLAFNQNYQTLLRRIDDPRVVDNAEWLVSTGGDLIPHPKSVFLFEMVMEDIRD